MNIFTIKNDYSYDNMLAEPGLPENFFTWDLSTRKGVIILNCVLKLNCDRDRESFVVTGNKFFGHGIISCKKKSFPVTRNNFKLPEYQ